MFLKVLVVIFRNIPLFFLELLVTVHAAPNIVLKLKALLLKNQ